MSTTADNTAFEEDFHRAQMQHATQHDKMFEYSIHMYCSWIGSRKSARFRCGGEARTEMLEREAETRGGIETCYEGSGGTSLRHLWGL